MNYEIEIAKLKKQYDEKIQEFNSNKRPPDYRDSNGIEEHNIDTWFIDEANKLKKKYNID